jgi:nucleoside-diphosphate-sugar epimerase
VKILLTGGSSFTGLWFARRLAATGHHVIAALKGAHSEYSGLRKERVVELSKVAEVVESCPFGSPAFMDLVRSGDWDILCQHASRVGNYRDPEFDVAAALAENTHNLAPSLKLMLDRGLAGVVLTGTVFEQDEGAGDAPLRAVSPYGLSKGLTWQHHRFLSETIGFALGKFVIPNPFGPYEEPRFCNFLIRSWLRGETPTVRTPDYVRDNVHVDLLAIAYADFVSRVPRERGPFRYNPSLYVETQGAFAVRLATEMAPRLDLPCPVDFLKQTDFSEPKTRINTEKIGESASTWNESAAWDAHAAFYLDRRGE